MDTGLVCHVECQFNSQLAPVPIYTAWWTEAQVCDCEQLAQGCMHVERSGRDSNQPATSRLQVRHPNHYAITPQNKPWKLRFVNNKWNKFILSFLCLLRYAALYWTTESSCAKDRSDEVLGSHTSWKVVEFKKGIFQAWKVMDLLFYLVGNPLLLM